MTDAERKPSRSSDDAPHVQGAAAFSKFMTVLQAIADEPGKLNIGQLTKTLPYPRGTLYRIVTALAAEGLIVETTNGAYQLGHRLISLASRSWEASDLRSVARAHIEALRDATGETVHLAVPSGHCMVYIDKLESPRTVRMASRIGTRVDLHSTSVGKAYLAALSPVRRKETVEALDLRRITANTIITRAALYAELEKTAANGYAIDNEENEGEIRCFGGAILDRNGSPVGGVSLSIPLYRFDKAAEQSYVEEVKRAVKNISAALSTII
ncbi:IclR family transcriptional regulator [Aquamicrobium sp. LC103]|uniref:IclR family transcriptional regulator n=1 Tax=Aquamicrobium sp. LC103 TaxID=1120658 RepID=UPI00063EC189|nr:IclR family transcriptional regulator [Aquamicrobium sp. LC103]TKT74768.1 IclR family transcriptional regulator [Aquamicrobium sp. LC103]